MPFKKNPFLIPRIYISLVVYGVFLSVCAFFIGSVPPFMVLMSMIVLVFWVAMMTSYHHLSNGTVFFICVAWLLICAVSFTAIFVDIRMERAGDLLLYGALGDESNYLGALRSNREISVIYNSTDVSGFYNTYLNFQRVFTVAGSYINGYYLFNIIALTLGNVFLSLAALKLCNRRASFSVFILLTAIPEGYFWSLTLYKEILVYLLVSLAIFFYIWGRPLYFFVILSLASFFRSVMILNFIAEFAYRNLNKRIYIKLIAIIFFIFSAGIFWYLFSDILDVFFVDTRVIYVLGKLNIFGYGDNSIILWLMGVGFVLLVPIIVMFQPTPFFSVSDQSDVYQLPWSDLVLSGLISLPILSLYVIHAYTQIISSIKNDVLFRFTFVYYFILSASFMFFTLRHRFSMAYVLLVAACIFLEEIRTRKVKLSFIQVIFYFSAGGFISYLVGYTKGIL